MQPEQPPPEPPFHWQGWAVPGALLALQVMAWVAYGREHATRALALITYPSILLLGGITPWWYRRMKGYAWVIPILFIVVYCSLTTRPKDRPRTSLLFITIEEVLETKAPRLEYIVASGFFFAWMALLFLGTAFVAGGIDARLRGKGGGGGKRLFANIWNDFLKWERKLKRKENSPCDEAH